MLTEVLERPLLGIPLRATAMHEVIEADAVLEDVVETTQDAEDTEGEDPDTDDCDDGCLATNKPTEQTEECSNEIDNQNGTAKLP